MHPLEARERLAAIIASIVIILAVAALWPASSSPPLPIDGDPLCISTADKPACEAHWRARMNSGERDPLGLLKPDDRLPQR
jgi:hypothetical protein